MTSDYVYTNHTSVIQLDVEKTFNGLTAEERLYAHHLSKSSWIGSLIVLFQTSPESPLIFTLLRRLLRYQSLDELQEVAKTVANFDDDEWRSLLVYFSAFVANLGNFRGFENKKFVPNLARSKLEALVVNSQAFKCDEEDVKFIWDNLKDSMYSLDESQLSLGFAPNGMTTYHSKNITEEDSKNVTEFMTENGIEPINTRVFKDKVTDTYEIRLASILTTDDIEGNDCLQLNGSDVMNGSKFVLSRGDYSPLLKILTNYLIEAKNCVKNETQRQMIDEYVHHFTTGAVSGHKHASRLWLKDKTPTVETYMGFVATLRDPAHMRGQFEGFVLIADKEIETKFASLKANAIPVLALLPWPDTYECDVLSLPDFATLDVLAMAAPGLPIDVNLPNYDDIRQKEGFKSLCLANAITAYFKRTQYNFLSAEDSAHLRKYAVHSNQVELGLHGLLGRGCGKLFKKDDQNKANFDVEKTINPLTNERVDKWYKTGETYDSVFTTLAGALEGCRAECVGLYLSLEPTVQKIFGLTGAEAEDVVYAYWLSILLMGIENLEMFDPVANTWLHGHCQAWYVITRLLIQSCKELVHIEYTEKSTIDGKPDLLITLKKDSHLLETVGKKAIGDFLLKLQVFKSEGDVESARRLFDAYSQVNNDLEYPYLMFRDIVLAQTKPTNLFVQSSTRLMDGKAVLTSHPATHEGLIQSLGAHIDTDGIDDIVLDLWRKDCKHFV